MVALKTTLISSLSGLIIYILSNVDFSNTITTGSVIATLFVVIIAGIFTIRANTSRIWRENYEAEKASRLQAEEKCREQEEKLSSEREHQQILRHELKNEVAALKMKTDLTAHESMETERHAELVTVLKEMQASQREMVLALQDLKS